jgi:hypothetical protein
MPKREGGRFFLPLPCLLSPLSEDVDGDGLRLSVSRRMFSKDQDRGSGKSMRKEYSKSFANISQKTISRSVVRSDRSARTNSSDSPTHICQKLRFLSFRQTSIDRPTALRPCFVHSSINHRSVRSSVVSRSVVVGLEGVWLVALEAPPKVCHHRILLLQHSPHLTGTKGNEPERNG